MTARPNKRVTIGSCECGEGAPLLLIAGPCVLEEETSFQIAEELCRIVAALKGEGFDLGLVFKGSFDKANRTSVDSWRGPGLERGLKYLPEYDGSSTFRSRRTSMNHIKRGR